MGGIGVARRNPSGAQGSEVAAPALRVRDWALLVLVILGGA
jgi:hypothetical protein